MKARIYDTRRRNSGAPRTVYMRVTRTRAICDGLGQFQLDSGFGIGRVNGWRIDWSHPDTSEDLRAERVRRREQLADERSEMLEAQGLHRAELRAARERERASDRKGWDTVRSYTLQMYTGLEDVTVETGRNPKDGKRWIRGAALERFGIAASPVVGPHERDFVHGFVLGLHAVLCMTPPAQFGGLVEQLKRDASPDIELAEQLGTKVIRFPGTGHTPSTEAP